MPDLTNAKTTAEVAKELDCKADKLRRAAERLPESERPEKWAGSYVWEPRHIEAVRPLLDWPAKCECPRCAYPGKDKRGQRNEPVA